MARARGLRWGLLFKISKKDWGDIKSNKQILLPMIILPVMMVGFLPLMLIMLPLSMDLASILVEFGTVENFLAFNVAFILRPFIVMIPLLTTAVIAADSWAGEKERKTAESLFLLPLSDSELLVAKIMSSLVPGLVISWASAASMMVVLNIVLIPFITSIFLPDLNFLFQLFLFTPVLAFFTIFVNVYVSYRARDTKSAQQIGGSVVVVFFAVLVGGMTGMLDLVLWILLGVFGCLDILFVVLAPRLFSREVMIAKF